MNDEAGQPAASEESPSPPSTGGSNFNTPSGMVLLGSFVLIGTYVVFGLLMNDYWVGWIALLLAVSVVLVSRASFLSQVAPADVITKALGYLIAIVGLFALVEDLRFPDGTLNEFPDVIGAIAAYAGYLLAFLGARSIKT